jgi:hypothetical protein
MIIVFLTDDSPGSENVSNEEVVWLGERMEREAINLTDRLHELRFALLKYFDSWPRLCKWVRRREFETASSALLQLPQVHQQTHIFINDILPRIMTEIRESVSENRAHRLNDFISEEMDNTIQSWGGLSRSAWLT